MHQFHPGTNQDEKDGEYVVSKISCQPQKQNENTGVGVLVEEADTWMRITSPITPMADAKSDFVLESSLQVSIQIQLPFIS